MERIRLLIVAVAGLALAGVFVTGGAVGSGDAYWYRNMLADFVTQWRAGGFPVFIGQSEYAFNGAISPLRFAPYLQHAGGILDLATFHILGIPALQNLTLVLAVVGGGISAYLCCAAIVPLRRWEAAGIALLYVSCPAAMALLYTGNLFMSVMTLPYLPMAAYGLWRWWSRGADDTPVLASAAWLALPLAALWWCHPPIALWTTAVVAPVAAVRLAGSWRDRRAWLTAAVAALLFALAAAFVFVSVLTLAPPPTAPVDPASFLGSIEAAFPASILPVSPGAAQISDYQLGWSLWLAALAAAAACALRPRRGLCALVGTTAIIVLFLMPVPGIDRWLWRHAVPQVASDITFAWAAQRLCIILAAFAAVGAAAALPPAPPGAISRRIAWPAVLCIALIWSGTEASKFIRRGKAMVLSDAAALRSEGIHNAYLTRYAFNIQLPVPGYFSHGYVDPYLENRILGTDGKTVLASNLDAAQPPDSATSIPLTATYNATYHFAAISPAFPIAPGVRYAARIELRAPTPSALLVAQGGRTERQYFLPDSSFGMIHAVSTHSFGLTPTSGNFFSIWSPAPYGDVIGMTYTYSDPAPTSVPSDFGRLTLRPYSPKDLPVAVTSWVPYRAKLAVPQAGAWLETPRLFVPGYAATANGTSARVKRSPDGLVMVELKAGANDVVLRYPGPRVLRASYWVSLLTWAAMLGRGVVSACGRSMLRPRASPVR